MNSLFKHKTIVVDGIEVLAIKWQDDDQNPCIRFMAYVNGIYAETELGFKSDEGLEKCWDTKLERACADMVELAKSAATGADDADD